MTQRKPKAVFRTEQSRMVIEDHGVLSYPERDYNPEEAFDDYDELYGLDAYLGDQYPATSSGRLVQEVTLPPPEPSEPTVDAEIRQEKLEAAILTKSESIEALEEEAALADKPLPQE
ncbi:MAG TPA: hypothetical protein V6C99_02990 [Oculatellaceae cyanobacterium]